MARVLIVDDDPSVLRYVAMVLSLEGHESLEATHSAQALSVLASEIVDCVLLDVRLGHEWGPDVLRQAQALDLLGATPVLMHSSEDRDAYWPEAAAAGAVGAILKPADPDVLLAAVLDACRQASRR
jgi:DNA-binding response OmpR family regulator